jgi:hypothetical protein
MYVWRLRYHFSNVFTAFSLPIHCPSPSLLRRHCFTGTSKSGNAAILESLVRKVSLFTLFLLLFSLSLSLTHSLVRPHTHTLPSPCSSLCRSLFTHSLSLSLSLVSVSTVSSLHLLAFSRSVLSSFPLTLAYSLGKECKGRP